MGSDKTYIFDGGGSGGGLDIAALVSSMMGNKGMDPNLVAALMNGNNNRGAWGGDGCWWIWIILLFFCWGGNGFGFGSLYLPRVARRLSRCARKNWSFLFAWLIR